MIAPERLGLTPEQHAIRATGIGASEVAAVFGLDPWRSALNLYALKTTPEAKREADGDNEEADPATVGQYLEEGIRSLYSARTGNRVHHVGETLRHPLYPHVLASPDGLPDVMAKRRRGLEIKLVGDRMRHHWRERMPDYVEFQAWQNLATCNALGLELEAWDVIALHGGTYPEVYSVAPDEEHERIVCEGVEAFWAGYVEPREPPPFVSAEDRLAYLAIRYPSDEVHKEDVETDVDDEETTTLATWLRAATERRKELEAFEDAAKAELCSRIGSRYGISGKWGKALWYPIPGKAAWKAIAEEAYGGAVPSQVLARHTGAPSRIARLYDPPKPKAATSSKRKK